ncbi:MAG: class I SAM-dependent methyltransferase [Candidatus Delongbacteria bacterium]|nr:class I SAM-dependent methyltransferase [Candidatus Delongbacteria bacterium]MBN2834361.1 class I SAM-dependent methyltransferase [Candidatus Delongbacteria bacterium]
MDNKDFSRYWNRESANEEMLREEKFPLVDIQTTLTWIKIKKYLDQYNISSILDAGAGVGRYSLPLAKFGYDVTHLDISPYMNRIAEKTAESEEIKNIKIVEGDISDLSMYNDRSYDFVISFDAPISYCYPNQYKALEEILRVCDKIAIIMVSSRSGVLPFYIDFDLAGDYKPAKYPKSENFIATKSILENGVEIWPEKIEKFLNDTGKDAPKDYSFTVTELKQFFSNSDFEIVEIGGPGALARSIKSENLDLIRSDDRLFNEFIGFSLNYDFQDETCGMGAVNTMIIVKRK